MTSFRTLFSAALLAVSATGAFADPGNFADKASVFATHAQAKPLESGDGWSNRTRAAAQQSAWAGPNVRNSTVGAPAPAIFRHDPAGNANR